MPSPDCPLAWRPQTSGRAAPDARLRRGDSAIYTACRHSSSLASRLRATCRRRLIVPTGASNSSLISISDWPRCRTPPACCGRATPAGRGPRGADRPAREPAASPAAPRRRRRTPSSACGSTATAGGRRTLRLIDCRTAIDRSQPGERRRLLELPELLEGLDEHLLGGFLGLGVIAQPLPADGLDHPLEPADQLAEGFVVAVLCGDHELGGGCEGEVEELGFEFHGSLERLARKRRACERECMQTQGSRARERASRRRNEERVKLADDRRRQSVGEIRFCRIARPSLPGGEATHGGVSPGALQCYGTAGSAGNARFRNARRRRANAVARRAWLATSATR